MEATDTLRSLLTLSDRKATGRLKVEADGQPVSLFLLDGHLVAAHADDDAVCMLDALAAAGSIPAARAEQLRNLTPDAMAVLQRMGGDPYVGLMMKAVSEADLQAAFRHRLIENVTRFVSTEATPLFEPDELPWVDNIQVEHDTFEFLCDVTGLTPPQAMKFVPSEDLDDREVFDSGVFNLRDLEAALRSQGMRAVGGAFPGPAPVDGTPIDDLQTDDIAFDDLDDDVLEEISEDAPSPIQPANEDDHPTEGALDDAVAEAISEADDKLDEIDEPTDDGGASPMYATPHDHHLDDEAFADHELDDEAFADHELDDEAFADHDAEDAPTAGDVTSAAATPDLPDAGVPEEPHPAEPPTPDPDAEPPTSEVAMAVHDAFEKAAPARPPGRPADALDDLDAFSGTEDGGRGGGADGTFVTKHDNLDTVELADEAMEPTAASFGAPTLSDGDARQKLSVANEVLASLAQAFEANGSGSGAETIQLLIDGRPREFGPLLQDIAVRRNGTLSPQQILSNLRRRPMAEQRRLIHDGLLDLVDRALDRAADELEDDLLDGVLESTAGYRQRFGL